MVRITMLKSLLLHDGVNNNAGQLAIETDPVQRTDCWAFSLCDEAALRSPNVLYSFVGTFRVASVAQPCSMPRRVV